MSVSVHLFIFVSCPHVFSANPKAMDAFFLEMISSLTKSAVGLNFGTVRMELLNYVMTKI